MNRLKELWTRWKVQISFVAGALVVSTTMGTCSFRAAPADTTPAAVTDVEIVEVVEAINEIAVAPVDGTTTSLSATTTTD